MASFLGKIKLLSEHRVMRQAYPGWLWARLTTGKPPKLKLGNNVRIGGWITFSEYCSFQNAVPEAERRFIGRCLEARPNKSVVFDIGANIGVFTCLLASMGARQIHAFEPIPETFCRLKNNVIANGMVNSSVLNCLAVGAQPELITFEVEDRSPATNHLSTTHCQNAPGSGVRLQHVAATSLDAYCESYGVEQIDFLKVDVEGMEPQVLRGGARMLLERRIGAILLEFCPDNLADVGSSPSDLFGEITKSGYCPRRLDPAGTPGKPVRLDELEGVRLENIVVLPS
jgi:FkbM family methyltransferase